MLMNDLFEPVPNTGTWLVVVTRDGLGGHGQIPGPQQLKAEKEKKRKNNNWVVPLDKQTC